MSLSRSPVPWTFLLTLGLVAPFLALLVPAAVAASESPLFVEEFEGDFTGWQRGGTGASVACEGGASGCALRLAPPCCGSYTTLERGVDATLAERTYLSFLFQASRTASGTRGGVVFWLDGGGAIRLLQDSSSGSGKLILRSDGHGERHGFATWPARDTWYQVVAIVDVAARQVTAEFRSASGDLLATAAPLAIPAASTKVTGILLWGITSSWAPNSHYLDRVAISTSSPAPLPESPSRMREGVVLSERSFTAEGPTGLPVVPLPPAGVPGAETPDAPGTGPVVTPDAPGTPGATTPDVPGTPGVWTPDFWGTEPVGTPDYPGTPGVATPDLPDTPGYNVPDVPATPGFTTPDVPGTSGMPTPDLPGTQPVRTPDVPGTPGYTTQDIEGIPGTPGVTTPDLPDTPGFTTPDVPGTPGIPGQTIGVDVPKVRAGCCEPPPVSPPSATAGLPQVPADLCLVICTAWYVVQYALVIVNWAVATAIMVADLGLYVARIALSIVSSAVSYVQNVLVPFVIGLVPERIEVTTPSVPPTSPILVPDVPARGETPVPDVPATKLGEVPDVPATAPIPIPDVPGLAPTPVPDVPATAPIPIPDIPDTPVVFTPNLQPYDGMPVPDLPPTA
ncbi:MAG TPA: hypothetical protein VNZ52_16445, partial [Candidatus Thermoplasmatota archaeon]|nr:hypothetical protein [Candidatus Thermoplasmatota archaeon]